MEKLKLPYPILVEGRYDKSRLQAVTDAQILSTEGFGLFRDSEKKDLIRRLAERAGKILVLTDSDGAGLVIRNHLNSILPKERIIHIYIPQIAGKERRKAAPSKEGYLGVEGMECALLRDLLAPYAGEAAELPRLHLTKADLFSDRLSGTPDSAARRRRLLQYAGLPQNLSANAMLQALNMLYDAQGYAELLCRVDRSDGPGTADGDIASSSDALRQAEQK